MRVLIQGDKSQKMHSTSWVRPWEEYCIENNIDYQIINLYEVEDIVETLKEFDVLLYHFGQYNFRDMLMARHIFYTASILGLKTFPNFDDAWHFDDKVAEMLALEAIGAPIPKSFLFFYKKTIEEAIERGDIEFPIVAKLRSGSGSHNVKMIKSKSQLMGYASKMFGNGLNAAPSLMYKTSSNIRASKDWATFVAKAKRAPEFFRTLRGAKKFPKEKGYVYLQEFIPNDGFDLKIAVVGDKLSYFMRPIRSHDFRASGGGTFQYDHSKITKQIIDSAFKTADDLKLQCNGFDYVVDNRTGLGKIVEMSYGFSHEAILGAGGYFDREGNWHDTPMNAPQEILKNILATGKQS
ncbi:MAG: hypothetical protein J1E97_01585 [Muribaculaceae bacterium]|nr:hypothetical protein [Muribaculaceae bacterium]